MAREHNAGRPTTRATRPKAAQLFHERQLVHTGAQRSHTPWRCLVVDGVRRGAPAVRRDLVRQASVFFDVT